MKYKTLLYNLLFWVMLYLFWILIFQKRELAFTQTATVEFCYLIFIALNYYYNVYVNIPRFLITKKYFVFFLLFIAGVFITALLRVPLAMFLNTHVFFPGKPAPAILILFTHSFINIFIWSLCIVAGKVIIDRFKMQQHLDEITLQKEKAELDFLNAQFNPHFLFNSINSIYAQIEKQNKGARDMLLSFSDMLRYQLYDCSNALVLIDKEIEYIKNYILLQKTRKGEVIKINYTVGEGLSSFYVSPLLFIAFIENAFKYAGSGDDPQSFIDITFQKKGDLLVFTCRNSKDAHFIEDTEHKGIGINNAKRRLLLLYPGKHELKIDNKEVTFEINLKINIA